MTIWVENENKGATEQTIHEKETEIGLICQLTINNCY